MEQVQLNWTSKVSVMPFEDEVRPKATLDSASCTTVSPTESTCELPVVALGRQLNLDQRSSGSLAELAEELQRTLQLPGRPFSIFDRSGHPISTNNQLQLAISQCQVPLCAVPAVEEPSSMASSPPQRPPTQPGVAGIAEAVAQQQQLKYVREQVHSASEKIAAVERQVSSLRQEMDAGWQKQRLLLESLQPQMGSSTEQKSLREVSERVTAVGEQMQWLREAYENSTAGRDGQAKEMDSHLVIGLHELAAELDLERRLREALEGKCAADARAAEEQIQAASNFHSDLVRDLAEAVKGATQEGLQQLTKEVLQMRANAEAASASVSDRLSEMEDRYAALESRIFKACSSRQVSPERGRDFDNAHAAITGCSGRGEGTSVCIRGEGASVCMPVLISGNDRRDNLMLQERQLRDDQLRQARQAWVADQTKHITDLERKLSERIEREVDESGRKATQRVMRPFCSATAIAAVPSVASCSTPRATPGLATVAPQTQQSPLRARPGSVVVDARGAVLPQSIHSERARVPTGSTGCGSPLQPRYFPFSGCPATPRNANAATSAAVGTPRGNSPSPVVAMGQLHSGRTPPSAAAKTAAATPPPPLTSQVRRPSFSPVRVLVHAQTAGPGPPSANVFTHTQ